MSLTAGDDAADGDLYTPDGEWVQLWALWAEQPIVVEFGSITCPIFTTKIERMDRLADRFSPAVGFYFIYSREAPPAAGIRHTDRWRKNGAVRPTFGIGSR